VDIVATDSNTSVSDGVGGQDLPLTQLEDEVCNGDSDGSNTLSSEDIKKSGASFSDSSLPQGKTPIKRKSNKLSFKL
jgi:hypothetical protein